MMGHDKSVLHRGHEQTLPITATFLSGDRNTNKLVTYRLRGSSESLGRHCEQHSIYVAIATSRYTACLAFVSLSSPYHTKS